MPYNGGMLYRNIAVFLFLLFSSRFTMVYAEPMVSLRQAPASLEKWYKPVNKRQVWLHTMFRLRREMQAIRGYAGTNDKVAMQEWIQRLDEDYNKIADMVPEWEKLTKPRLLSELKMFTEKGDIPRVGKTLKMISRTCDDCHTYYQPLVTAIYRSPSYDDINVKGMDGKAKNYKETMTSLSESVNRVLIALTDGHKTIASKSGEVLARQLKTFAESCERCHENDDYPRQRILGDSMQRRLDQLQVSIGAGEIKESRKLMGEIAVTVCARCHNIHRIVSDLRDALLAE